MSSNSNRSRAVILLPGQHLAGGFDDVGRTWMARGRVHTSGPHEESLYRVARLLEFGWPDDGLAALKFWGQTGEPSSAWMLALDPVYLEPRLDHLCMHSLEDDLDDSELRDFVEAIQSEFGNEQYSFASVGRHGFLRSRNEFSGASQSAAQISGLPPDEFISEDSRLRQMIGELQMFLHEHPLNTRRAARGAPPVNSFWFWGGGKASSHSAGTPLPLYSDDVLFKGLWLSRKATVRSWTSDIEAIVAETAGGFVAVAPRQMSATSVKSILSDLRSLQGAGTLGPIDLLFRDGLTVHRTRRDSLRFWRRNHPDLEKV